MDLGELFDGFSHAWRLETRDEYAVASEAEAVATWRASGRLPSWAGSGWRDDIQAWRAEGRQIGRVHLVSLPPSPYIWFETELYQRATLAGEDIRMGDRAALADWDLCDFWLFDNTTVALMRYGADDAFLGAVDASGDLMHFLNLQEAAIAVSVPLKDWTARVT